jgi:hypothetical protein
MELNAEQMEKVLRHLGAHPTPECAICHHDEWAVSNTVFVLPEYRLDRYYSTTQAAFPAIPITCKVCGNVLFLSAIKAEVVPGVIKDLDLTR